MSKYGVLIDYEYCTGCHTCEIACQQEHGYEPTKMGIKVKVEGPTPLAFGKWQYDYIPVPTAFCDHCNNRLLKEKRPSCVHHCQAGCIQVGTIDELAQKMTGSKMVLYTLK